MEFQPQTLRVTAISKVEEAKNGRKFIKLSFRAIKFINNQPVFSNQIATRLVWGEYTDGANTFKSDLLFDDAISQNLAAGALVEGAILSFVTSDYRIGENTVNSYKTVVFDNEYSKAIAIANKALAVHGACCIVDGEATNPDAFKSKNVGATA